MKIKFAFLYAALWLVCFTVTAQVKIEGVITVDIPLPKVPEVIIVKPDYPTHPERRGEERPNRKDKTLDYFGEITNQNGPNRGAFTHLVRNAKLQKLHNGLESVLYYLDSGDILELIIATGNAQDYNYHTHNSHHRKGNRGGGKYPSKRHNQQHNKNTIVKVLLNNKYLDLRDGSLSLQPKQHGFHSVINLHSLYEGDFNGTVNF